MKSVKNRLLLSICLFVFVILIVVGGTTIFLNSWTTDSILEQNMLATAEVTADRVSYHLRAYKSIIEMLGENPLIANPDVSVEEKQACLDETFARYDDIIRGNILDSNGISVFTGQEFSDRDYFQHSIKGESWVSDPLVSKVTGAVTIIISAPTYYNGQLTGVVYLVPDEDFLNKIVSSINLSKGGSSVIINKNGVVVAHPNMEMVSEYHNTQELVKTDPSYTKLAALERDMMAGKHGFDTYVLDGVKKIAAYAPIPGSDGWSIQVNSPQSDFTSYTRTSIVITSILLIISLIVAVILASSIANGIGSPLKLLSGELTKIATTGRIEMDSASREKTNAYTKKKDEVGEIALAVNGLIDMLTDNSNALKVIADGDLTKEVVTRSPDDTLGNALNKMLSNLKEMFSGINNATVQVSSGSRQIANGSQALAQGSTEQAAAVEQLSASISEVAKKTQDNAGLTSKAAVLADNIKRNAERGNEQMSQMISAVNEISVASQSINKVMKVIDDIAFQTNILALNAAVEAARAGQHGKGFAVVAEEVRNLAAKSADAARDTGSLIANSMEKAELGVRIANETAESLSEIVSGINESSQIVNEIAISSDEQATAIAQINGGIEQVALVVQQNSATAEESAASSEEMSEQSIILEKLLSQFRL